MSVGNVVLSHHALGARRDRRTRESPRFVNQRRLGGNHLALFGRAQLYLDLGAGGWAGGLEHLLAGHLYLHRVAALTREQRRHRLHVHHCLCAEPATDFQRDGLDVGNRDAHEPGSVIANCELPLAAGPDGQLAVGSPLGGASVGLDVALVYRDGLGLLFYDDVGLLEALFHVTEAELELVGDVAALGIVVFVQQATGAQRRVGQAGQFLVHSRGVGLHCLVGTEHRREDLVVDLDESQRLLRHVRTGRSHGCDGMALVQSLAPGQHVHAEEPEVLDGSLGQVGQPPRGLGPIGGGYDCVHPGVGLCGAGIDGFDSCVGVGTAQYLAVQQAGEVLVGSVPCPPGHFFRTVGAYRPLADDVKFLG